MEGLVMAPGAAKTGDVGRPSPAFWSGRRVLVTGHTGFKGAWLVHWLTRLGADVFGIALPPQTRPALFTALDLGPRIRHQVQDIRDGKATTALIHQAQADIVFHLAAQPLVREGYRCPLATFETNLMGTVNILDAIRDTPVRAAIMITTDKVYAADDANAPAFVERDRLGGSDPYAASKAASEIAIACYRDAYLSAAEVAVSSVRAGNVIGGGDWSAERLIPDMVRAWSAGDVLRLRHPEAIRPWQHVLEPLRAYILLAERSSETPALAGAYNVGPEIVGCDTVANVVARAREVYPKGRVASAADSASMPETALLRLDASLIAHRLGVRPVWSLDTAVRRTMNWYDAFERGASAAQLCDADLEAFETNL